jgi:hypothetical protein
MIFLYVMLLVVSHVESLDETPIEEG